MPNTGRFLSRNNEMDIERVYAAVILSNSWDDAVEILQMEGFNTNVAVIKQLCERDPQRFEERRNEFAPIKEGRLANNLLDNASVAEEAIGLAVAKTRELLLDGRITDPLSAAKVARELSQVATQAVDKRLALQGRPTKIVEHRDLNEIVRALEAMKVIQVIDSTAEDADG